MNIFITGGSRGLGRAVVLEAAKRGDGVGFTYVSDEAGAKATLEEAEKLSEGRGTIRAYKLDVGDSAACEEVADQAVDDFDEIQGVVNNAGIVRNGVAFTFTDEDWDAVIRTNLSGAFFVTRAFLGHFVANRYGKFLHIGSLAEDGSSGQVAYAAAKAGLHGLSRTIAKEYGPKGVRSNVIVVGFIDAGMSETDASDHLREFWLTFCPLRQVAAQQNYARSVLWLLSPDSDFISGESIRYTGGLTYSP